MLSLTTRIAATSAVALCAHAEPETWLGESTLPNGAVIPFIVTIDLETEPPTGTIEIEAQGLPETPLGEITVAGDTVSFRLPAPAPDPSQLPVFELTLGETTGQGVIRQAGMEFPASLELDATGKGFRPQSLDDELPYRAEDVTIPAGEHTLAGTLVLPDADEFGEGPYPAVVFVTGSGPQDRDETIAGHRPFALIADRLARRGVASLRHDDRGVGGSSGEFASATTLDFVDDTSAAAGFLAERDDIGAVGLIGHSEGGLVAPIVATEKRDDIAFIVSLAGMGVNGASTIRSQSRAMMEAAGLPVEQIETIETALARTHALIESGAEREQVRTAIAELIVAQGGPPAGSSPQADQYIDGQTDFLTTDWMRGLLAIEPGTYWAGVDVPVLLMIGELDLQVLPDTHLPPMQEALADNDAVTVKRYEGLNHLFQPAETGQMGEYGTIRTTFDEDALSDLVSWVAETSGAGESGPTGE